MRELGISCTWVPVMFHCKAGLSDTSRTLRPPGRETGEGKKVMKFFTNERGKVFGFARMAWLALPLLALLLALPLLAPQARAEMGGGRKLLLPLGSHRQAPLDFTLRDVMTGREVRLSSLRGKVVVVNFWSIACPPCRAEIETLKQLWKKLKGMDVEVITVHVGGHAEKVRAFMQKKDIDMPVLHDEFENVAKSWGVVHLPVTYVLDPEGRLAFVAYGARNWKNPQMTRLLLTLVSPLQGSE